MLARLREREVYNHRHHDDGHDTYIHIYIHISVNIFTYILGSGLGRGSNEATPWPAACGRLGHTTAE